MVALISVDAYPFLAFSDLACHLCNLFFGCTVLSDSKEAELGISNQEAPPSAGKNTGVVLVPCHVWKYVPTAISGGVDIS